MDLKSGYPFWAVKNGLMHAFPPLAQDLAVDVAIIGGGPAGLVTAYRLRETGWIHSVSVMPSQKP